MNFKNDGVSWTSAEDITASDSVALDKRYIAFIIDSTGGAGTVAMKFADDTTLSLDAIAGVEYQYSPKYIMDTGTTATGIKGLV